MKISTYGSVNFVSGMSLDRPTRSVRLLQLIDLHMRRTKLINIKISPCFCCFNAVVVLFVFMLQVVFAYLFLFFCLLLLLLLLF